jgi:hypothetical protein
VEDTVNEAHTLMRILAVLTPVRRIDAEDFILPDNNGGKGSITFGD